MNKLKLRIPKELTILDEETLNCPSFDINRMVFVPLPESVETIKGFYTNRSDGLAKLLKANANNPAAILYIADMLA